MLEFLMFKKLKNNYFELLPFYLITSYLASSLTPPDLLFTKEE
jgi:hypothetical protein